MHRRALRRHLARWVPPWRWVRPPACGIPGMISVEECKYYAWLGRFFTGAGEVIELGPWLGRSTVHIVTGLRRSRPFRGRKLHVVDDFVWRSSWMDRHYPGSPPADGECFRPLFERHAEAVLGDVAVAQQRICEAEGNGHVPALSWSAGPIELLYVDCGRTLEVNEAWFAVLSPWFIVDRTLIVMQDWQTYRETPIQPYNQTKRFTDGKGASLELVHELRAGCVGTFLYRG